ncbi:MAG: WxcM-like domain-containing protein [Mangrovimonas sp.]|nr:WxcM-like domain-containing protein [Mangrovimonas sp.]MCB0425986.1 WxcM-like domain-containing protein [Mangrovimonas sp.]MCB0435981.1 WxcM-like domain-containing protein [Mangrovimonas sp.]MCB0438751.1 WxcM-like domain-containing protein [Mangrovimonas sp.]MCB0469641.1 WxcM-like domain-containing protein [Flavobacteriaceae bacterium]
MAKIIRNVMSSIDNIKMINIPTVLDPRGKLAVVEKDTIPFSINRVYYLYDVPSDAFRGGHAHKKLSQILVALSGSFEVYLKDGKSEVSVTLNKPNKGLLIKPGIWREIGNFSSGSVCLVLASDVFDEADYIRDYDSFLEYKKEL